MSEIHSNIEIKLKRADRVYRPNEDIEGSIVIYAKNGWNHKGIKLKSVGMIYLNTTRPGTLGIEDVVNQQFQTFNYEIDLALPGKCPDGNTEIPFSFTICSRDGMNLVETYHGVCVSIIYTIIIDCDRGLMKKALTKELEYCVEIPMPIKTPPDPAAVFDLTPQTLKNVNPKMLPGIPDFQIVGKLHQSRYAISQPFTGELTVKSVSMPLRSIELQLVRVETVTLENKSTKEATEIQNIQICQGDICKDLTIPIYMVFPRLYTCPTISTPKFKVDFEVNLIVVFSDGHLIMENCPVILSRES
jgi:hypothetical protein